jgi:hypothetical protein
LHLVGLLLLLPVPQEEEADHDCHGRLDPAESSHACEQADDDEEPWLLMLRRDELNGRWKKRLRCVDPYSNGSKLYGFPIPKKKSAINL